MKFVLMLAIFLALCQFTVANDCSEEQIKEIQSKSNATRDGKDYQACLKETELAKSPAEACKLRSCIAAVDAFDKIVKAYPNCTVDVNGEKKPYGDSYGKPLEITVEGFRKTCKAYVEQAENPAAAAAPEQGAPSGTTPPPTITTAPANAPPTPCPNGQGADSSGASDVKPSETNTEGGYGSNGATGASGNPEAPASTTPVYGACGAQA